MKKAFMISKKLIMLIASFLFINLLLVTPVKAEHYGCCLVPQNPPSYLGVGISAGAKDIPEAMYAKSAASAKSVCNNWHGTFNAGASYASSDKSSCGNLENSSVCLWKILTILQASQGYCQSLTPGKWINAEDNKCSGSKPGINQSSDEVRCCCDVTQDYKRAPDDYSGNSAYRASQRPTQVYEVAHPPIDPLAYANGNPAVVIGKVISTILMILGSIALIMFIYGGFTWMTAFGNETRVATARKVLIWSTLGLMVIFLSYILVGFLLDTVSSI